MNLLAQRTGSISFSKIFTDKRDIAVVFPSDFHQSFRLTEFLNAWSADFQALCFYYPDFQYRLFKEIVTEPKIRVSAFDKMSADKQTDLLLLLSEDKKAQKMALMKGADAVAGYGKRVNVRLLPFPSSPLELCQQIAALLKLPHTGKQENIDISSLTAHPSRIKNDIELELRFIFDFNTVLSRFRISSIVKKLNPPCSYLTIRTTNFSKKSCLTVIRSAAADNDSPRESLPPITDKNSAQRQPAVEKSNSVSRLDLLEILQYSLKANGIITDYRPFYELLLDFRLREKVLLYDKSITKEEVTRFINRRGLVKISG